MAEAKAKAEVLVIYPPHILFSTSSSASIENRKSKIVNRMAQTKYHTGDDRHKPGESKYIRLQSQNNSSRTLTKTHKLQWKLSAEEVVTQKGATPFSDKHGGRSNRDPL